MLADDLTRRTGRADRRRRPAPSGRCPLSFSWALTPLARDHRGAARRPHQAPGLRRPLHPGGRPRAGAGAARRSKVRASRRDKEAIAERIGGFRFGAGFGRTLSQAGARAASACTTPGCCRGTAGSSSSSPRTGCSRSSAAPTPSASASTCRSGRCCSPGWRSSTGHEQRVLKAREFHQIAGRAGRAGFDTSGSVVVQAPEHVIENAPAVAKAGDDPKKLQEGPAHASPPTARSSWTEQTFDKLVAAEPEPLRVADAGRPRDDPQRRRSARATRFAALQPPAARQPRDRRAARPGWRAARITLGRSLLRHRGAAPGLAAPDRTVAPSPCAVDLQRRLRPQPAAGALRPGRLRRARPRVPDPRAGRRLGHRGHPRRPAPGAHGPAVRRPRRGGRRDEGRRDRVRGADGAARGGHLAAAAGRPARGDVRDLPADPPVGLARTPCRPKSVVRDMYERA